MHFICVGLMNLDFFSSHFFLSVSFFLYLCVARVHFAVLPDFRGNSPRSLLQCFLTHFSSVLAVMGELPVEEVLLLIPRV